MASVVLDSLVWLVAKVLMNVRIEIEEESKTFIQPKFVTHVFIGPLSLLVQWTKTIIKTLLKHARHDTAPVGSLQ